MKLVIIESPYAGDVEENVAYARACVRDCLLRGEAPIASHLLYTQPGILDDLDPAERQHGIDAGLAWRRVADASVVYTDRGISKGMEYGIAAAEAAGVPVVYRTLARPAPDLAMPASASHREDEGRRGDEIVSRVLGLMTMLVTLVAVEVAAVTGQGQMWFAAAFGYAEAWVFVWMMRQGRTQSVAGPDSGKAQP